MPTTRDHIPSRPILEARKRMYDAVRRHFDTEGFLETETPIAVSSPGLEPHLDPFVTKEIGPDRAETKLYLHTSPEYAMKRLLASGLERIYQIARVFRNGERSKTHAPEFTLLEWYRKPGTLEDLVGDVEVLIRSVANAVGGPWRPEQTHRLSTSEAFGRVGLGDPLEYIGDPDGLSRALQTPRRDGDDWDTLFFRAFLERVEPSFPSGHITIIDGYPAPMAALSKIDPADPRRALRFEVYVGPLELGNAFFELSDPIEQRRRFEEDLGIRARLGKEMPPIDEDLLAALPRIENSAGIALGLDRLLARCLGLDRIQDVIPFSPRSD